MLLPHSPPAWLAGREKPPSSHCKSLIIISSKQDCLGRGREASSLRENWGQSWLSLGMENITESINILPFLNSPPATPLNHVTETTAIPQQALPWEAQVPPAPVCPPQPLPCSCIPSHHTWRAFLRGASTVCCLSGQQTLLQRPRQTFPSKASAQCELHGSLCPAHTFPLFVCLFQS